MKNKITQFLARTGLKAKHNAPTALTLVGVGALIAAGVMAAKATTQMGPSVATLEDEMDSLEEYARNRAVTMPDDEHGDMMEKVRIMTRFGVRTIKTYGPAIALAAGGTAAVLYSHGIMKRREASLIAAYGVLERTYAAYRDRVRESFGPEVDEKLAEDRNVVITDVDKKTGVVNYDSTEPQGAKDDFRFPFGPGNRNWNEARPEWNLVFLRGQEKFANHLLQRNGFVFLNEVLEAMGMDRTSAGAVTGWTKDGPDGFIDFGLYEAGSPEEQDYFYFFNGLEDIVVELNVQGLIWDTLGKKK